MNHVNSIIMEGNMVNAPLLKYTNNGTAVCTFKIASDRFYKKDGQHEKETCFMDVQAWGKLAEIAGKYGHKGCEVRVTGRMKTDMWNGPDGRPRSKNIIVAENVEFRRNKKEGESGEEINGVGSDKTGGI